MALVGTTVLRCVSSGVLAAVLFLAAPHPVPFPVTGLPTPAAVVVADAAVGVPGTVPLPTRWWAHSSVPALQIASVPVVDATQAAVLGHSPDLVVLRSSPLTLDIARETAARDWAIRDGALQWHPRSALLALLTFAAAALLGVARWRTRGVAIVGVGLVMLLATAASVWVSPVLLAVLPIAWFLADASHLFSLVVWAENRIAAIPTRRPASVPTPLPIAHR